MFAAAPVVYESEAKAPGSLVVKQQSRVDRAVDRDVPVPEQPQVAGQVGPGCAAIAREGTEDQFGAALDPPPPHVRDGVVRPPQAAVDAGGTDRGTDGGPWCKAHLAGAVQREILPAVGHGLHGPRGLDRLVRLARLFRLVRPVRPAVPVVPVGQVGAHVGVFEPPRDPVVAQVRVEADQVVGGLEGEGRSRPAQLREKTPAWIPVRNRSPRSAPHA